MNMALASARTQNKIKSIVVLEYLFFRLVMSLSHASNGVLKTRPALCGRDQKVLDQRLDISQQSGNPLKLRLILEFASGHEGTFMGVARSLYSAEVGPEPSE